MKMTTVVITLKLLTSSQWKIQVFVVAYKSQTVGVPFRKKSDTSTVKNYIEDFLYYCPVSRRMESLNFSRTLHFRVVHIGSPLAYSMHWEPVFCPPPIKPSE